MPYIIFKNNQPVNSYNQIPYHILGLEPNISISLEELAELDCYDFIDSPTPSFDCNLYYQVENWEISGTSCIRTWTLGNQDQNDAWKYIKSLRNEKLVSCDWTVSNDSPLTTEKRQEWMEYRQILRNIPQTYQIAQDVVWPTPPQ